MSVTYLGEQYVNQKEALEVTGVTRATFIDKYERHLQQYTYELNEKEVFYKKADVDRLHESFVTVHPKTK